MPSLTELDIHLDSLIHILQRLWESDQLHVSSGAIVVSFRVRRITFDAFRVILDGASKVSGFKLDVSFFTRNCALLGVNIGLAIFFGLEALNFTQFVEDIGCAVLGERLLIIFNGG